MLPFDNKSELQVLVDHDEGTPLEVTLETARLLRDHLVTLPEVRDVEVYAGTAAPFNFNGLVRHYFLRREPFRADLQVNLVGKEDRGMQSHDFAKAIRPAAAGDRPRAPGAREGGGDPARAAGARHAGGGDLRPDRGGSRSARARRARPVRERRRASST